MGLDFAYELIARRSSADRLVRSLTERLAPDSQERLSSAHAHGVERIMDHFERRNEFDQELYQRGIKAMCLTFLFTEDEHVSGYMSLRPERVWPPTTVDGRVPVGCVMTSVDCGDEFVRIRADAGSSDMSRLFSQSASVRATFVEAGEAGDAIIVVFDDEADSDLACVWPYVGRFAPVHFAQDVDEDPGVDAYSADLIRAVQSTFTTAPPGA